ncbi:hypothetical protein LPJ66_005454 [Kickxella alabastrina]|uniref:Uncharacterized protein n=1 Tax=Kickxella alabastrina TaxID=61397 RepID=A0ACC1IFU9_9FUNG|nr:hypothetical protein LPJ66_005454 [Kickxella alabastrina]
MKISFVSMVLIGAVLSAVSLADNVSTLTVSTITLAQLNQAVPARASDTSCAAVSTPSECAPNSRAATAINKAIAKYGVTGRGEIIAIISLMAFESADWQYNINHFPGRAGQGTRAMLMYNWIEQYAKQVHAQDASKLLATAGAGNTEAMNKVRKLVLGDDDSFGAAFWYLVTAAPAYHNSTTKLREGNVDDFKDYVVNGVGAGWENERQSVWARVNSALSA